jgi:hypothetical protein
MRVDPALLDTLIRHARVADTDRMRIAYELCWAIRAYRARTLADKQERPARIVAALKPGPAFLPCWPMAHCGMMLRMNFRDPRVSKAIQVAFVAMSALWLVNFSTQETHTTLSWVLLPLNILVLVGFLFLLLRDFWKPIA